MSPHRSASASLRSGSTRSMMGAIDRACSPLASGRHGPCRCLLLCRHDLESLPGSFREPCSLQGGYVAGGDHARLQLNHGHHALQEKAAHILVAADAEGPNATQLPLGVLREIRSCAAATSTRSSMAVRSPGWPRSSRRPPTAEPAAPPTHKIRLPCRRTCDQRAGTPCTKTCRALDRRAMQFVRLPSSRETCAGAHGRDLPGSARRGIRASPAGPLPRGAGAAK